MPHTNRKRKSAPAKRVEVVGDDGWTRVTTTNQTRRHPRPMHDPDHASGTDTWRTIPEPGVTVDKLLREFEKVKEQWQASESCRVLEAAFAGQVLVNDVQLQECIVFGSGSFCGLRQGWISRRSVAMCQLAVLLSIRGNIERTGAKVSVHAQDPAYNNLDIEFLKSLDVVVEEDPHGFDLVTDKSFVYTPCAEMHVEMEVLKRTPAVLLTGKLDWFWRNEQGRACTNRRLVQIRSEPSDASADDTAPAVGSNESTSPQPDLEKDCEVFERFRRQSNEMRLPSHEVKDNPFTDQHLYWLKGLEKDGE